MFKIPVIILIPILLLSACTRTAPVKNAGTPVAVPTVFNAKPIIPTGVSIQTYLPPTRDPAAPINSPTPDGSMQAFPTFTPLPDNASLQTTPTPGSQTYTVESGDFPSSIAEKFGISTDELLAANSMGGDAVIYPGDSLIIPVSTLPQPPSESGSAASAVASSDYFKILPDSELIYGPLSSMLDVNTYIQQKGGYLAFYTQDVNGENLNGAQILIRVAHNYSVNPRLLLALLEYRAQWVTNPNPAPTTIDTPIGYVDDFHQGLYRQLTWSADMLNQGFYRWKESQVQNWTLSDGTTVVPQPGINPGTAAVQHLFSKLDTQETWLYDTGPNGLYTTFNKLFGYPFDLAIEPLLPAGLTQPALSLPFQPGQVWQFTGGPHAGWDQGSAWAGLDFAPPGEPIGCAPSDAWVTAVAPGLILRADNGAVVQDLDGDGIEQTGWTILYMHIETRDRVQPGTTLKTGDKIGHPSCEGGLAAADHLHLARRYNGLWIPAADPRLPFVLGGYVTSGNNVEYDGRLTGNGKVVEAWDGSNAINQIQR
ncbi:MAG: LysM peptidoglycan-binding domain-containing M23 family metallopeptidase [Chloroflexi bacterium]|nr:LysM peptidoglycan-binding domain-containing M23 family metallopeptidase [Chloroflexota bacterium]